MTPQNAGEWAAVVIPSLGFIGWLIHTSLRTGKILQRIDDIAEDHKEIKAQVATHEKRITWLECGGVFKEKESE